MNELITNWLMNTQPWVKYRTQLDLLGMKDDHPEVIQTRTEMLHHPMIRLMINELKDWE